MPRVPRCLTSAVYLSVIVALATLPAAAADKYVGSKNFSPPASVPNYFSNESGPMLGGRADSRVVDPPNVAAVVPPPPQSLRAAAMASPPAAAPRAAKGHGRVHHASARHGKSPGRHVAAARGKARTHIAAARSTRAATKSSKPHRAS